MLQQMPWRLPRACRVWSPDVLASLPTYDFTSSAYKILEELIFNPFCRLRELESRSSDPILLKELRGLIFTFIPASKVLTWVLMSCPFDSLKGEMLWKSKLQAPFAWFCYILCLLFFRWCYWELWLWRKCGTTTVIRKSFFSHFGSIYWSVLVLSSPVKCIWLNLLNWPLKCSTFIWDIWQSVVTQLCTIACFRLLSSFVIGGVQKNQVYFIFLLGVILAYDVVLGWPTEEKTMLYGVVMWKALYKFTLSLQCTGLLASYSVWLVLRQLFSGP